MLRFCASDKFQLWTDWFNKENSDRNSAASHELETYLRVNSSQEHKLLSPSFFLFVLFLSVWLG